MRLCGTCGVVKRAVEDNTGLLHCTECCRDLPPDNFYKGKNKRTGKDSKCKECRIQQSLDYQEGNEQYRTRRSRYMQGYNKRSEVREKRRAYDRERLREYNSRPEVKARKRERDRERRQNPEHKAREKKLARKRWPQQWLRSIKNRAERNGLPFDLTVDDLVVPAHCPALDIPLKRGKESGVQDESPTVDRVIPARGYTKGNVEIISSRANRIKQDATPEELRKVANWLEKKAPEDWWLE